MWNIRAIDNPNNSYMKQNQDYKNEALSALKGNWAPSILAVVVYFIVSGVVVSPYMIATVNLEPTDITGMAKASSLLYILMFLISYPLVVGLSNAFRMLLVQGDNALTANMFAVAFRDYLHKVWTMFLMYLFIFLWSLLLIIPGIVMAFAYSMVPFILEEHPELSAMETIRRSRAMMKGRKFDLFYLLLSFIGWAFLCLLTCGIGFLWLQPYMQAAVASFYEDVKADFGEGFDAEIKMSM